MKATVSLKAPGKAFTLPRVSKRVVNRLAAFTAAACVAAAWTFAMLDKDTACAVTALVGFIAVMAAQKKGGEL